MIETMKTDRIDANQLEIHSRPSSIISSAKIEPGIFSICKMLFVLGFIATSFAFGALPMRAMATPSVPYPMLPSGWTLAPPIAWVGRTPGVVSFARYEGMPSGTVTLNGAVIVSTTASFSEGTLEFDMKPLGYDDAGIIFHRHGQEDGEFLYLRANPDCPAADDCIQYAPVTHGLMGWDIYPDYQGPAPITATGWNHVRLVVVGEKMLVYVNREATPSLIVPRLQGLTTDGGIAFKGPAIFANLVVRSVDSSRAVDITPPPSDPSAISAWLVAPPSARTLDHQVTATDIPQAVWRPMVAEPNGLMNLSRAFGAGKAPSISVGWLKTVVVASAPMHRIMRVGFARGVSVFLNGKLVFSGENTYYPSEQRLAPNGRLEADNASIPLDLRQGKNEIVLAVTNLSIQTSSSHPSPYGWGAEAHFDDLEGLRLP